MSFILFLFLFFPHLFFASWQLRSMSRAGTPAQPPPACRALKRLFTRPGRRWASPASPATSCRARPPSTASLGTRRSGTTLHPPAEVRHTNTAKQCRNWKHADFQLQLLPWRSSKCCLPFQRQRSSTWMNASWMVSIQQSPTLQV